ncbi:MAG: glycerol-3-phosphate acyltransferase [Brevinematia bacterium]
MKTLILFLFEFFIGAMMFSYWIGALFNKDIRLFGDSNPGAFNLGRALGFRIGVIGALLDFFKGLFPLTIFTYHNYISGWEIFIIGLAPILGHAFSPFLKFKGGKGVAVTFGVWSALTFFEISLVYGILLALFEVGIRFFKKNITSEDDAVITIVGLLCVLVYMLLRKFEFYYLALLMVNFLVMSYKNIKEIKLFLKHNFLR